MYNSKYATQPYFAGLYGYINKSHYFKHLLLPTVKYGGVFIKEQNKCENKKDTTSISRQKYMFMQFQMVIGDRNHFFTEKIIFSFIP